MAETDIDDIINELKKDQESWNIDADQKDVAMKFSIFTDIWKQLIIDEEKSWVAFSNGTCVILTKPHDNLKNRAIQIMKKWGPVYIGSSAGDFSTINLSGFPGWIVTCHHPDIIIYVSPDEIPDNQKPDEVLVGIVGRDKRDQDAKQLEVIHVEDRRIQKIKAEKTSKHRQSSVKEKFGIKLTRKKLQYIEADIIAYGAKDTGEMGGGAAISILRTAGEKLPESLRQLLSKSSSRQVGDVFITDSFGLKNNKVKQIFHIISIIKYTPQGAYCPHPEKLSDGVAKSLKIAHQSNASSIAFSALGTGEGRVTPENCAKFMLRPAIEFFSINRDSTLEIIFSLPTYEDYAAFKSILTSEMYGLVPFLLET